MKITKIIYLSCTPISKIVGDKIDPWWYLNNGFKVEFWNLSAIYYSKKSLDHYFGGATDYKFIFPNEKVIIKKITLEEELKKVREDTIFNLIDFGQGNDLWILSLFKRYKICLTSRSRCISTNINDSQLGRY